MEVYVGSSLDELTPVASTVNPQGIAELRFIAIAGREYQIRFVSPARFEPVQLELLLDALELAHLDKTVQGPALVQMRATLDRVWHIEASHDLSSWIPISTNVAVNGWQNWSDPDAGNFARR